MNVFPEYQPDGTLKLRLEIKGNNLLVENGRPIHLNLNLEQNVLQLLESLRYVDGLSGTIDEKVQQLFQQPPTN
jgi:hypothetical protein